MEKLDILYTQPSYSPFFELGSVIPDVLIGELEHSVLPISTGWHSGDAVAKRMETVPGGEVSWAITAEHQKGIFRQWMHDTANKLLRIVKQNEFDLFFSFIGDRIPLSVVKEIKKLKIPTLNWDEIDPYPDYKITYVAQRAGSIYAHPVPHFWQKVRTYDAAFCAYYFSPNWMPLAGYSELYEPPDVERTVDVGFVGNTHNLIRKPWLELFKEFNVQTPTDLPYRGLKAFYKQCKIVINDHQNSTLNGRTFEATANGALLITDYCPGLEECFKIGKEIVLSKSWGVEEVRYYLENEDERKKIAKAGYKRSKKDHQFKQRLETMIKKTLEGDVWTWKKA